MVPLLTNAGSAPWCPSHAGAGMLHTKFFFGRGGHPSQVWRGRDCCSCKHMPWAFCSQEGLKHASYVSDIAQL